MELDLTAYVALAAELAAAAEPRDEVLARRGLDEAAWDGIDADWQERLSEALGAEGDGVPELLAAHAAAYATAQRELAEPISLEQFADVTRLLQATGDLTASLARVGVRLCDYLSGSELWSQRIAQEPEIERRFERALRGRRKAGDNGADPR